MNKAYLALSKWFDLIPNGDVLDAESFVRTQT